MGRAYGYRARLTVAIRLTDNAVIQLRDSGYYNTSEVEVTTACASVVIDCSVSHYIAKRKLVFLGCTTTTYEVGDVHMVRTNRSACYCNLYVGVQVV